MSMKQFTKYTISLEEVNGISTHYSIYPSPIYKNTKIKEKPTVVGYSDSIANITASRQNGIFKLRVNNEEISFDEKLWYKVVETMLTLNLEIINSN